MISRCYDAIDWWHGLGDRVSIDGVVQQQASAGMACHHDSNFPNVRFWN